LNPTCPRAVIPVFPGKRYRMPTSFLVSFITSRVPPSTGPTRRWNERLVAVRACHPRLVSRKEQTSAGRQEPYPQDKIGSGMSIRRSPRATHQGHRYCGRSPRLEGRVTVTDLHGPAKALSVSSDRGERPTRSRNRASPSDLPVSGVLPPVTALAQEGHRKPARKSLATPTGDRGEWVSPSPVTPRILVRSLVMDSAGERF
jgi:hypothetical protein